MNSHDNRLNRSRTARFLKEREVIHENARAAAELERLSLLLPPGRARETRRLFHEAARSLRSSKRP